MKIIIRKIVLRICFSILVLFSSLAWAEDFTVKDIKIYGLNRVSLNTTLNYLPIKKGDKFTSSKGNKIIQSLYGTGFFTNVNLQKKGNVLIINVVERPTIGTINYKGNKTIDDEQFKAVLKQMNLVRGYVFNQATLDLLKTQLEQEYNRRGKYNARIDIKSTSLTQNRVAVNINISEGRISRINKINIIGNHAFSEKELISHLKLSDKKGLISYFTKRNQYSKDYLNMSLDTLKMFYLDHGFIKFRIDSSIVLLSSNKKSINVNIKITEGDKYNFAGYQITGKYILPKEQLDKLVKVKKGRVFSKDDVQKTVTAMGDALGDVGYGFPRIQANPRIDENTKTVFITFDIRPGRHVYVRKINFHGNTKTADYVLRQTIKQQEGSLLSLSNARESERQLRLLGYLKNISFQTTPVDGVNNQVDLDFDFEEAPSTMASASIGYGTDGPEFNAAYNQANFMGTGRKVGVNFNASYWGRTYSASYYNPYYTKNNIGRGFSVYYKDIDPDKLDVSTFTSDKVGGAVNYNAKLGSHDDLQFGYGFEHLVINSVGDPAVAQYQNFIDDNGSNFNQLRLNLGWTHSTYDRKVFPTIGFNQQTSVMVALPADQNSLTYYKASYHLGAYYPLFYGTIFKAGGNIGYGNTFNNTGLPFYENYYAGGIAVPGTVRGYENYSLGPKDSNDNAMGGNFLVQGSLSLILPRPVSSSVVRTSLFVEGGNVYSYSLPEDEQGTDSGPIRYSVGVELNWRSPFGPLSFSLAKPLNKQDGDNTSMFNFTIASAL